MTGYCGTRLCLLPADRPTLDGPCQRVRACDRAVGLGGEEALGADRGQRQHARQRRLRRLALRQRHRRGRLALPPEFKRLLRHVAQHLGSNPRKSCIAFGMILLYVIWRARFTTCSA